MTSWAWPSVNFIEAGMVSPITLCSPTSELSRASVTVFFSFG